MEWLSNFFIPLFQVIFILSIFLAFIFILGRALYKSYIKTWKWKLKYAKYKPDEEDMLMLMDLDKALSTEELQMKFLIKTNSLNKSRELLYLYNKIPKGEIKNDR